MIGVTFSIKYDATYSERYQKLYEVFRRFGIVKDRTTSCVFLNTEDGAAVKSALYLALDYTKDKAVVFTTFSHTMIDFGVN
ncbi:MULTISPECIES: hypothetical protein [Paracoccus]|uniref:Uncharacterized protein n=1 Tax=Paracoccus kondratievae TaxID=135740 RepID=A0AAD3NY46_9RHOB|nr:MULTISPECIES: hypothetical protein [Paracoccus]AZV00249.1 hypothetical protein pkon1_p20 [Paracoccus phage vB_PkoS_Pkon1]GLK63500.1 hypothetical protein GCM10017635_09700 [Paracoccus kondratievae]